MRFTVLLTALAICLAAPAFCQTLPGGAVKGASLEGITEYTYPNGLRVLLFPDPTNPKVTVNVTYLVGSRHEGYGETGMAHLLEHLLFIQTTNGREIKKELTAKGAQWNGSTWFDRTNYFETFTAGDENLKWALGLEADRMLLSKMEKALLDTEMTVVRNEFERGENSPARVLQERVLATAYLWHNYGKSTIGARADIENVPIDRLAAFYRKYYQPDNAVVVIAGQIDEQKTLGLVAESLGRLPRPQRTLDVTYTTEPVQDGERYVALRRVGDGQAVMMAYHTPAAAHPDSAALEVLAGIMSSGSGFRGGGGMPSGRLYKALVENKKAVSAQMRFEQLHDPGFALVTAQLDNNQSRDEARKVMMETVEGLAKEPPTAEEVERSKTRLLRAVEMSRTNSQMLALNLSEWVAMGDWRLHALDRDLIRKVTPADVMRVAKTYFMASNRTVGEFIPTANPERAEVPATPSLTTLFKDYKSTETIALGESFDPTPANVEARMVRSQLDNGMKLAVLPRKTRGATVSAVVQLHFGDPQSLRGQAAAAQMTGALLMRGTKNRTREQLQDAMDKLKARITVSGGGGGGFGGGGRRGGPTVTSDASSATAMITTTAENLPAALRLAVEMLREPAFNESDFDQVRQQRLAAIESSRSEPDTLSALELRRRLSPFDKGDPRYVPTLEEQTEELKKVTLDDAKRFHQRFYGASNGVVVVVGEFDQAELKRAAAEALGAWKSPSPYTSLATPYRKTEPANLKIETPDKQNAQFEAGVRIKVADSDADYAALVLANQMFGGSLGARMPNRIRNVEGLSYGVRSTFAAPAEGDGALFSGMAISAPQNTPKVEASFVDELRKTLTSGFTAAEVETAKKAFRESRIVGRSQEMGLMITLAERERRARTMKWDEEFEARVQALTVDQVNAAFRRHLDPAALTIVKAGDFKKAGAY